MEILVIPSNLYIWTRLENRDVNLKSTKALIDAWWNEILRKSVSVRLTFDEINKFKNNLIEQINIKNSLMIPKILFSSVNPNVMNVLNSQGMIIEENNRVGFVHQSFYDSFLVDAMMTCIYNDDDLILYLGDRDKQVPSKRYQLQLLLEILLDQDVDKFAELGRRILNSTDIRFYLKYVFLQVMGSCTSLDSKLIRIINDYLTDENWSEHFYDAVFTGNRLVVSHYASEGYFDDWMKDKRSKRIFGFLRSISISNDKEVLEFLKKHSLIDENLDNEIYYCIERDIENDSDELFEFRCELLKKYPRHIYSIYNWNRLIKKRVDRAVDLLQIIIKFDAGSSNRNDFNISEESYKLIKTELGAESQRVLREFSDYVFYETKGFERFIYYDREMSKWTSDRYNSNMFNRLYIELCIQAAINLFDVDKNFVLNKVFNRSGIGTTIVFNEIALEVLQALPKEDSDFVIEWIIKDPHNRLFNYTGMSINYLHTVGNVIEKHSVFCSDEIFNRLSEMIYSYKPFDMVERARYRFEANHQDRIEGRKILREWCYWGTIQYTLIPKLDATRVSLKLLSLHQVLHRRKFNGEEIYTRNVVTSGSVTSTLKDATKKLSLNNWIDIINNGKIYDLTEMRKKFGSFKESSPRTFARDLVEAGKSDSELIKQLIFALNRDTDDVFVDSLYEVFSESGYIERKFAPIDKEYMEIAFRKFGVERGGNVAISFCRIFKRRRGIKWSEDIYSYLKHIAIKHINPDEGEYPIKPMDETKIEEISNLEICAINSARGCAAGAIADLLFDSHDLLDFFKPAIEHLMADKNLAVSMASVECVIAIYNIDKSLSGKWFIELSKRDLRLMGYRRSYNFLYNRIFPSTG